jgi:hypothetical protein
LVDRFSHLGTANAPGKGLSALPERSSNRASLLGRAQLARKLAPRLPPRPKICRGQPHPKPFSPQIPLSLSTLATWPPPTLLATWPARKLSLLGQEHGEKPCPHGRAAPPAEQVQRSTRGDRDGPYALDASRRRCARGSRRRARRHPSSPMGSNLAAALDPGLSCRAPLAGAGAGRQLRHSRDRIAFFLFFLGTGLLFLFYPRSFV